MKSNKYTKRVAAAAGSLAGMATLPSAVDAGVISVSNRPVSLSTSTPDGTSATWDIDGDGTSDFRLENQIRSGKGTYNTSYGGTFKFDFRGATIFMASNTVSGGQGNGRGLVAPFQTDNVLALSVGDLVDSSRLFGRSGGSAQNGFYVGRNAFAQSSNFVNSSFSKGIGYDFNYGFGPGDNYFGFRFADSGGSLHYGWGVLNFDIDAATVTIKNWAYQSVDELGIVVDVVPEPSSLALLACGAAGLGLYRARRTSRKTDVQGAETNA